METTLDIGQSIVGTMTLLVSVIVFVMTIRNDRMGRWEEAQKERRAQFFVKLEFALRYAEPQRVYDKYEILYGIESYSFSEIYSDIVRVDSELHFASRVALLYVPGDGVISTNVSKIITSIEDGFSEICHQFCSEYIAYE